MIVVIIIVIIDIVIIVNINIVNITFGYLVTPTGNSSKRGQQVVRLKVTFKFCKVVTLTKDVGQHTVELPSMHCNVAGKWMWKMNCTLSAIG